MPTTEDFLRAAATDGAFDASWAIVTRSCDADAPLSLNEFKVAGNALFAAGCAYGATQVLAVIRGESNQERPNDGPS